MLLGWFDARAAVAFANATAAEIRRLVPPSDHTPGRKEIGKRMKKLERVVLEAKAFSARNGLNVYKKSRLANTLRLSLQQAGYSEEFVSGVVELVVLNL